MCLVINNLSYHISFFFYSLPSFKLLFIFQTECDKHDLTIPSLVENSMTRLHSPTNLQRDPPKMGNNRNTTQLTSNLFIPLYVSS